MQPEQVPDILETLILKDLPEAEPEDRMLAEELIVFTPEPFPSDIEL
jgi:hypothetical protein